MLFVCLFVLYFVFQLTNKDITDSIDAEMDGDLQKAFMTLGGHNIFVIQYFLTQRSLCLVQHYVEKMESKQIFPQNLRFLKVGRNRQ